MLTVQEPVRHVDDGQGRPRPPWCRPRQTGTVADISTGDHLVVIGTTSGSTVPATAIR